MKKNNKLILVTAFIIILMIFTGCGAKNAEQESNESAKPEVEKIDAGYGLELTFDEDIKEQSQEKIKPKIIQKNDIDMETLAFDECIANLEEEIYRLDGYIEESNIEGKRINSYGEIELRDAYFTFRVPQEEYRLFLNSVGKLGNIVNEHKTTEDVTLKYYDNETKLESKKIHKDRLLELLKETKDVEQLIAVERELAEITYDIESLTTQLRKWDNLIDYVTVRVSIEEVRKVTEGEVKKDSFGSKISASFSNSIKIFGEFIEELLIGIIYLLPYLIIVGIILLVVFKVKKKNHSVKKSKEVNKK
jgi:preprotein translocase subunit SecG